MRKIYILIVVTIALFLNSYPITAYSQSSNRKFEKFSDRLFYGGFIGLSIGQITQIDVLPMVGMWILPEWSIGLTGRYSFHQEKFATIESNSSFKTHIWGASGFTQVLPIPDFDTAFGVGIHGGIILHGEFETLYVDRRIANPLQSDVKGKEWIKMYLAGGGYRQKIGDRSALNILVLWDLTQNEYSPYSSNPILRVSITF